MRPASFGCSHECTREENDHELNDAGMQEREVWGATPMRLRQQLSVGVPRAPQSASRIQFQYTVSSPRPGAAGEAAAGA
jgi:hypothetical protein